jgi:hypothetical protein
MRRFLALLLPLAPLTAAAPPVERPAGGEDPARAEIVVTGERGGLSDRVESFVASVTAETGNGQVARWDRRLCLEIEGLLPTQRDFFAGSLAAAGLELGLDVTAGGSCDAAALIVFTPDADALLSRVAATRPRFFAGIPAARRRELLASRAPVRWLSRAELRGSDGETPSSFSLDPRAAPERPVPATRAAPSRVETAMRMDLQSMIVIVDGSRLAGVSNRSLADYLAMVVLGNVRPDHRLAGAHSILGLLAERQPGAVLTEGLTDWDRAYLHSLYSGSATFPGSVRMQRMAAAMERRLASSAPAD